MKISKEFKVGLFMIIAIVSLYFGFNYLKGIDFFSSNRHYYVIYNNVDKLALSNQVYINGYAVGRVSDIDIIQNLENKVLVELEISSDISLNDSTVAILTGDFLGNKSIKLEIGSGSRILVAKDTLNSMLDRGIADILAESAVPVAANLQVTLRKLNSLVDNFTKNTQQLDTIFGRMQATPLLLNKTLVTANGQIGELSSSFKGVANNLNATLVELKPTLANFHELSDSLKALELSATLRKVQVSMNKLSETLTKVNEGDNTVSKLLNEDKLYVNLNKLLLNMDSLANHLNNNPKHFLGPLGQSRRKIERDLRRQEKENK